MSFVLEHADNDIVQMKTYNVSQPLSQKLIANIKQQTAVYDKSHLESRQNQNSKLKHSLHKLKLCCLLSLFSNNTLGKSSKIFITSIVIENCSN